MTGPLKAPCEHGRYEAHGLPEKEMTVEKWKAHEPCPGGVFLPEDALIIEKVDGEWPKPVKQTIHEWFTNGRFGEHPASDLLHALAVRDGAE